MIKINCMAEYSREGQKDYEIVADQLKLLLQQFDLAIQIRDDVSKNKNLEPIEMQNTKEQDTVDEISEKIKDELLKAEIFWDTFPCITNEVGETMSLISKEVKKWITLPYNLRYTVRPSPQDFENSIIISSREEIDLPAGKFQAELKTQDLKFVPGDWWEYDVAVDVARVLVKNPDYLTILKGKKGNQYKG